MENEPAPVPPPALRRVLRLAAVVALALALGLVAQELVTARFLELDAQAHRSYPDRLAARQELATWIAVLGGGTFGATTALGVCIVFACRRSLALLEFPPPGLWSWGGPSKVTGPRAAGLAKVGLGLGVVLVLASVTGGSLVWYMAAVLRACRR
jgi:hypothetical protein